MIEILTCGLPLRRQQVNLRYINEISLPPHGYVLTTQHAAAKYRCTNTNDGGKKCSHRMMRLTGNNNYSNHGEEEKGR